MASTDEKKAIATPSAAPSSSSTETYCPICGKDAPDPSLKRFGEHFCSEAHVAEYTRELRAKQAAEPTAAAAVAVGKASTPQETGTTEGQAQQKKGGISGLLKMAGCCGGMLLLLPALGLVNLGGLAAVGGSLLSIVAVLACPIGMYFMMRGMMKPKQHGGQGQSDGREDRPRLPGDQTPPTQ